MWVKRSLIAGGAILLPLFIGATSPQLVNQVRNFAIGILHPMLETQDKISFFVQSQGKRVANLPFLEKKNAELTAKLSSLQAQVVEVEELKSENARLNALLGLKQTSDYRTVAARIIGRDPAHWSFYIILNKGTQDGVRENTPLLHTDGLVGKVVSANAHSARAILLTDRQSRVSALNQRTRDVGLTEGTGSLLLKMTFLDRNADIQIGDLIVSSGLGGIYPKGISIGRVQLVGEEDNKLGLYAIIKPFVSFAKLEEVLCVESR